MRYTLKTIVPAAKYPVERDDMMNFLKLDPSDPALAQETILIEDLIGAATAMLEDLTGRAFITQTLEMTLTPSLRPAMTWGVGMFAYEDLPEPIRLWRPPCQSITALYAFEQNSVSHTVSTGVYNINLDHEPAEIRLSFDGSWPYYVRGYYKVRYVAGYGDNLEDVPAVIRQAIRVTVAQWYASREHLDYSIPTQAVELLKNISLEARDL